MVVQRSTSRPATDARRAFTVIEMLVVLGIMALLIAVAIPLVKPAFKDRKLREASRQLNAFFAGAKSRAAEHGRHVALWFERDANLPNRCLDIYMAEVPPPYSGDVSGAVAFVRFDPTNINAIHANLYGAPPSSPEDLLRVWSLSFSAAHNGTLIDTFSLIKAGESFLIQFDHRGLMYPCTRVDLANTPTNATDDLFVISIPAEPGPYPPPYPNYPAMVPMLQRFPKGMPPPGCWHPGADGEWGQGGNDDDNDQDMGNLREAGMGNGDTPIGLPFQIFRRPMKSTRVSMQMPNGTAIDLGFSGVSATGKQFDAYPPLGSSSLTPTTLPVVITVSPTGNVDRIYLSNDGRYFNAEGTVHLLVGHNDKTNSTNLPDPSLAIPAASMPALTQNLRTSTNLGDMTSFWVSFGNSTGNATTESNADMTVSIPLVNLGDFLANARQLVRSSQSKGGG